MEISFLKWLQSVRTPFWDSFFKFYTRLGDHGELWIFFILYFFFIKKDRDTGILAGVSFVIEVILISLILKPIFSRPRPFLKETMEIIIKIPHGSSFPSGHSASSFAVASLFFFQDVKHRWFYLVLATLMAFSRLYLFVHYPSDVFVGSLLGIAIAYLVFRYQDKILGLFYHFFEKFNLPFKRDLS